MVPDGSPAVRAGRVVGAGGRWSMTTVAERG
jgi:hypothetical protein